MEFVEQPNNHRQVHQKHYPVAAKEQEDAQQGVGSELGYHPEVQSPAALLGIQVGLGLENTLEALCLQTYLAKLQKSVTISSSSYRLMGSPLISDEMRLRRAGLQ